MTAGRRPPGRRPRRARSTLRHRGRPTLSSACPYSLPCPISSSLAPFALARTSPDVGVHGLLDPAEPELGAAARLGDGVARASLVEAEPELVFRNEERAQDADRRSLAPHLRCCGASAGGRRGGPPPPPLPPLRPPQGSPRGPAPAPASAPPP